MAEDQDSQRPVEIAPVRKRWFRRPSTALIAAFLLFVMAAFFPDRAFLMLGAGTGSEYGGSPSGIRRTLKIVQVALLVMGGISVLLAAALDRIGQRDGHNSSCRQ
jgi:hypothetical protein